MVDIEIEVPAMDVVLADEPRLIGLVDRGLEPLALADEFAAHIDIADMGAHGGAGDEAAFDEEMRIMAHDLAVLAGAGLGFIGIDDEIVRAAADCFGMKDHLRPVGKPAPPRPLRPEAFISSIIRHGPCR